jgi:hypothetical protein
MKKLIIFVTSAYLLHRGIQAYRNAFSWRCKEPKCTFFTISDGADHVFQSMQDHMRDVHAREV